MIPRRVPRWYPLSGEFTERCECLTNPRFCDITDISEGTVSTSMPFTFQALHHPGIEPLVPAPPQGRRRAGVVGDPPVRTAEDEHLDELVEDDAISHARAVAAERMGVGRGREQGGKLVPDGFDDG